MPGLRFHVYAETSTFILALLALAALRSCPVDAFESALVIPVGGAFQRFSQQRVVQFYKQLFVGVRSKNGAVNRTTMK